MDLPTLINFIGQFGFGKRHGKQDSDIEAIGTDLKKVYTQLNTTRGSSIKYKAKNLIAQYPVLCSDNLSSKSVTLVTKALEHEYVNLLKLLIQNDSADNFKHNTATYLKQFHNNIHHDKNADSYLNPDSDATGMAKNEAVNSHMLAEANKELLTPIEADLNQRSLNEDTVLKEHNVVLLTEKGNNHNNAPKTKRADSAVANIDNVEIKKANELSPTNVAVDITYTPNGSTSAINKKITFGVKCVAHLLESNDIEYYLPNSVITRTPIMRMIQWTTGEIKFFKDFLFSIDEIKKTATKANDKNNFWWRKLQELSRVSKMNPMLNPNRDAAFKNRPIPITTMVISKENVDNIKHKHGIDILQKPSFTKKIMQNFFLMTFVIVDESIETVYIFNDETGSFNSYSYRSLEGYSKQNNIDIKDIYSLLK